MFLGDPSHFAYPYYRDHLSRYQHSRRLEEGSYRGRTADFFFLWLFCAVLLVVRTCTAYCIRFLSYDAPDIQIIQGIMYFIPGAPPLLFLASSLAFAVVYVWSRRNKNVTMSFLGLFTFTAPYLPWVILGFGKLRSCFDSETSTYSLYRDQGLMLGQNPIYDLLGLGVGHIYYFLEDVYPGVSGRRLLKTPGFMYVWSRL